MTNLDHSATPVFDIGIVGGGPAGLTAAIWSARYGRSVVLVDSGDPRNWETRSINGYLGMRGVRPVELRGDGRTELRSYGVTLIDAAVSRVASVGVAPVRDDHDGLFAFDIDGHPAVHVRRVLVAIGMRDVWPDIPGLSQVYGANAHVCPDCDGYDARGKRVAVIGNGRRAVAMALALTTWTSDIVIATNGSAPDFDDDELQRKLDGCGIGVRTEPIVRLEHAGTEITGLILATGDALEIDKLFFTIAQRPADDLGVQLGCARDTHGHITVTEHFATSVSGVFAAGDITPGPQLAIRAAAAGAVAAMAMHRSLVPEQRRLSD
ncbi:MAG: NAD(P)/FAD-dependent oxidoreductase [Gemmatimonadaceae bacterium]|nr:NAD(P)/FAD-dependent oxidoreductase [Gemmatimonadaceae bacterium]